MEISCWASLTSGQAGDGSQGSGSLPRFQAREVGSAEQLMLSRMPEGQLRQQIWRKTGPVGPVACGHSHILAAS